MFGVFLVTDRRRKWESVQTRWNRAATSFWGRRRLGAAVGGEGEVSYLKTGDGSMWILISVSQYVFYFFAGTFFSATRFIGAKRSCWRVEQRAVPLGGVRVRVRGNVPRRSRRVPQSRRHGHGAVNQPNEAVATTKHIQRGQTSSRSVRVVLSVS